jgi:mono/diheme cytochrome c family protein
LAAGVITENLSEPVHDVYLARRTFQEPLPDRAMRRVLKGAGYAAGGVVVLLVLAAAAVYVQSERVWNRTYDVPLTWGAADVMAVADGAGPAAGDLSAAWATGAAGATGPAGVTGATGAASPADVGEGERLARILGCYGGCHGTTLEGGLFFDEPRVARVTAPNLTLAVREHTEAELERVIRRGVRRDGRSVFAMPSPMFSHLADDDYVRLVAFLRSQPVLDGPTAAFVLGPMGRLGVALGQFPPLATHAAASSPARAPRDDALAWGRYVALTVCSECHGPDLRGGGGDGGPPDLRMAAAFSEEAWFALMRTGRGLGDRELGLMGRVALSRFQYLTDDEIRALHAYLGTLAD